MLMGSALEIEGRGELGLPVKTVSYLIIFPLVHQAK